LQFIIFVSLNNINLVKMSKLEEVVGQLVETAKEVDKGISEDLMRTVCKYLGPNLYNKDASLVAYSDKDELGRIRDNFVKKKLGVKDSDAEIDAAIKAVGEKYGMSVRNKKRAVVYACLMKHYGKTSL